jgi:hypothetical protein
VDLPNGLQPSTPPLTDQTGARPKYAFQKAAALGVGLLDGAGFASRVQENLLAAEDC